MGGAARKQGSIAKRQIVVTQDDYFPLFVRDLDAARQRVVIYSPFLTPDRVAMLEPHVRGAVERGVRLYLVTKTLGERSAGAAASARPVEDALARWGVTVLHKFHMHEKLVFIDEDIAPSVSQSSPTPAGGRLAQS